MIRCPFSEKNCAKRTIVKVHFAFTLTLDPHPQLENPFAQFLFVVSSVTDPKFWRSPTSLTAATSSPGKRCGCGCGGCAFLKEMIHPQWQMTTSPIEKCRISRGRCGISLRGMLEISKILDL
jgi:hypothetical protein